MVVCGGLPTFDRIHRLSSQILVVVCGGLSLKFVLVCGSAGSILDISRYSSTFDIDT